MIPIPVPLDKRSRISENVRDDIHNLRMAGVRGGMKFTGRPWPAAQGDPTRRRPCVIQYWLSGRKDGIQMAVQQQHAPAGANGEAKLFSVRVRGDWKGGLQTDVKVRTFAPFTIDEPAALGGGDAGPNPVEYVLGGLAGCASVMLAIISKEKGMSYDSAHFNFIGTLDVRGLEGVEGVCPYFNLVKGTVKVKTDAPDELFREVVEDVERRCPVYTMIKAAGVQMQIEWAKE